MKGKVLAVVFLAVFGFLVCGAWASENASSKNTSGNGPVTTVSAGVASQNVWRGFARSHDSVVFQPSMRVDYKGVFAELWGNFDTDRDSEHDPAIDGSDWTETRFMFGYTYGDLPWGLKARVGGTYYALDSADDMFEFYAGLLAKCPWSGIEFGLTYYRTLAHYPADWFELSANRAFGLPWHNAKLRLSASAFYLRSHDKGAFPDPNDSGDEFSDLLHAKLGATVDIPVKEHITVTPELSYTFALNGDAKNLTETVSWDNHHDHFYGGVTLRFSF